MKRDQSTSLTYMPPRMRVVDAFAETAILADSKMKFNSQFSIDELEGMPNEDTEQYWFE